MSSRPVVIAGFVGGVIVVVALFAGTLLLVAMGGEAISAPTMSILVLGTVFGFVLDSAWLCVSLQALAKLGGDSDGGEAEDGTGWDQPGPNPVPSPPPSDDPDWWPDFEADLRAYLEHHDRMPVAG